MRTLLVAFISGIVGTVFTSMVVIAWTGPTSAPPSGNVAAPLNVGSTDQVKNAGLGINSLAVFGNQILSGASRYINFGTTVGASGYGIRDNNGSIELKNRDGFWSSVPGVPSGGVMAFDLPACPSGWSSLSGAAGRFIIGMGSGCDSSECKTFSLNQTGGEYNHRLTVSELPSFSLAFTAFTSAGGSGGWRGSEAPTSYWPSNAGFTVNTNPVGGNQAHNVTPP